MIRTKAVKLTVIPAIAFRQKINKGDTGITLIRSDTKQPGMATISSKTGEPVINRQTDQKKYPKEAFVEAMDLTRGLPYRRLNNLSASEKEFMLQEESVPELAAEEVVINSQDYQKIIDRYTDRKGQFSYDLLNKDLIKFAKSSSVVRDMVAEGKSNAAIRNYIVSNKFRNITGNDELTAKELKKIVELLDETSPKGIFKDLDQEIRKMQKSAKGKK